MPIFDPEQLNELACTKGLKRVHCFQMLRLAAISVRNYAKKVLGSGGSSTPSLQSQRIRHEAETNPVKLATYCCGSNIKQTGEDVKLGADEDYPDWLWKMHLGRPLDPKDLDPNTEEYWERLQKVMMFEDVAELEFSQSFRSHRGDRY